MLRPYRTNLFCCTDRLFSDTVLDMPETPQNLPEAAPAQNAQKKVKSLSRREILAGLCFAAGVFPFVGFWKGCEYEQKRQREAIEPFRKMRDIEKRLEAALRKAGGKDHDAACADYTNLKTEFRTLNDEYRSAIRISRVADQIRSDLRTRFWEAEFIFRHGKMGPARR